MRRNRLLWDAAIAIFSYSLAVNFCTAGFLSVDAATHGLLLRRVRGIYDIAALLDGSPHYTAQMAYGFSALAADKKTQVTFALKQPSGENILFSVDIPLLESPTRTQKDELKKFLSNALYHYLVNIGAVGVEIYAPSTDQTVKELIEGVGGNFNNPVTYGSVKETAETILLAGDFSVRRVDVQPQGRPIGTSASNISLSQLQEIDHTIVGIDVGGTDIKVKAMNREGREVTIAFQWEAEKINEGKLFKDILENLVKLAVIKLNEDIAGVIEYTGTTVEQVKINLDSIKREIDGRGVQVDAIGIGWPDVIIDGKVVGKGSKTKILSDADYNAYIKPLADNLSRAFGDIPVAITTDGNLGAFWSGVVRNQGNFIAMAFGTSFGIGYIDGAGKLADFLLSGSKSIVEQNAGAKTEYDKNKVNIPGALKHYLSQAGVKRLAEEDAVLKEEAERGEFWADKEGTKVFLYGDFLKHIQGLADEGLKLQTEGRILNAKQEAAIKLFEKMGEYLAAAVAQYYYTFDAKGTDDFILFGRVAMGESGRRMLEVAKEALKTYPGLPHQRINIVTADDLIAVPHGLSLEEERAYKNGVIRFAQTDGAVYLANQKLRFVDDFAANPRPVKLTDTMVSYIWGGTEFIPGFKGVEPTGGKVAELWVGAHKANPSQVIINGTPVYLNWLIAQEAGNEIMGEADRAISAGEFPLLFKILDAAEPLAFQVHPKTEDIPGLAGSKYLKDNSGKNEAWYVLEDGAEIYIGFKPESELKAYLQEDLAKAGLTYTGDVKKDLETLFRYSEQNRYPIDFARYSNLYRLKKGDVVNVPAGTLHAIKQGKFVELQQPSNNTFRVWDHNRFDPGRPLHITEALAVLDFGAEIDRRTPQPTSIPQELDLVTTEFFALHQVRLNSGEEVIENPDSRLNILTVMDGSVRISWIDNLTQETRSIEAKKGESLLIPAALTKYTITGLDAYSDILRSFVP